MANAHKKFVIGACEYFIKWVKTEAIANITQRSVEKFLWRILFVDLGYHIES